MSGKETFGRGLRSRFFLRPCMNVCSCIELIGSKWRFA
jgi:hypothetical protein